MEKTIDLTPTPEALRRMREMFRATMWRAGEKVAASETLLAALDGPWQDISIYDHAELICEALEALIERELGRIGHMRDGIEEVDKTGA